jgi:hypothetical protein
MRKAKDIGTRAETAVRNHLLSAGYSELDAHRNVLKGTQDEGDVWLREINRGLIVFEVKGGKMAKEASHGQVQKWLQEAWTERDNAGANYGFLVTQRPGVGYPRAGEWWAYATVDDILALHGSTGVTNSVIVRLTLEDLVGIIRGR